jgi:hypothetical protein
VSGFVRVLFKSEAVILMEHGFAEFAAVRLGDFYFPGRHWTLGFKGQSTLGADVGHPPHGRTGDY